MKTKSPLQIVYEEKAMKDKHVCSGCDSSRYPLSHSHIIPRSQRKDLEDDPENITYHCLDSGTRRGCHDKHEGFAMMSATLNDFVKNMMYCFSKDKTYFWQRYYKLVEFWSTKANHSGYGKHYIKATHNLDEVKRQVNKLI